MVIDPDPGIEPVSPGDVPDPGIELWSPALQADSLPAELSRKPKSLLCCKLLLPGLAFCVPWANEPFAVFHYLHPLQRQDEDEVDEEVGQVSGVWKWSWNFFVYNLID